MKIALRILLALVIVGAVLGLGAFAYRAGVMHGAAQNLSALPQTDGVQMPFARMHPGFMHTPFFGLGCLGLLVPLFLICLIFAIFRGLFWHGRMHHGCHGYRGPLGGPVPFWKHGHMHADWDPEKDVPPFFNEWHRRMHENGEGPKPPEKPAE